MDSKSMMQTLPKMTSLTLRTKWMMLHKFLSKSLREFCCSLTQHIFFCQSELWKVWLWVSLPLPMLAAIIKPVNIPKRLWASQLLVLLFHSLGLARRLGSSGWVRGHPDHSENVLSAWTVLFPQWSPRYSEDSSNIFSANPSQSF